MRINLDTEKKMRDAKEANGEIAILSFFLSFLLLLLLLLCEANCLVLSDDNLPKYNFCVMGDTKFVPLNSSSIKQVT